MNHPQFSVCLFRTFSSATKITNIRTTDFKTNQLQLQVKLKEILTNLKNLLRMLTDTGRKLP